VHHACAGAGTGPWLDGGGGRMSLFGGSEENFSISCVRVMDRRGRRAVGM
jgi:hypothetical protein